MPPTKTENSEPILSAKERERPTLKTIARIAGLAVPTVSRALSNAPDINSETKERVRAIADELGYRPNRAGLRLKTGKTNVIALVLSTDHDVMNHTARLIGSLAAELRGTPYHLIVLPYFPDESPMTPIEYVVRTGSADGVILNRIEPDDPRIAYLRQRNFPVAMHGRTADCTGLPYYDFDNAAFGKLSIAELARRGRKRAVLVAPPLGQSYAQHMVAGARNEARVRGMDLAVLKDATSDSASPQITEELAAYLRDHPNTDAIMTASAPSAIAATIAVEGLGRTIGKDIDIAAKEGIPFLKAFRSDMIVLHEDVAEAGQHLSLGLIQAIEHPELPPMQRLAVPNKIDLP